MVVVTRHVQSIKAPRDDQDESKKLRPDIVDLYDESCKTHLKNHDGIRNIKRCASKVQKGREAGWTRESHGTRSITKRQPDKAGRDVSRGQRDIVNESVKTQGTTGRR